MTETENMTKELITRKEAAQILGVNENTLAIWKCNQTYDNLPCYKLGKKSVRYKRSEVLEFLNSGLV